MNWAVTPSNLGRRTNASWHFAIDQIVRIQRTGRQAFRLYSECHWKEQTHIAKLVPIRFVPANKLTSSDKMMAAFDALALSKSLGVKTSVRK